MNNTTTALGALGITSAKKIGTVEVKEIQEYIPAGVYDAKIKTFGTYTSKKGALMGFAELVLNVNGDERTIKDYIYIPADQSGEKDIKRAKMMEKMKDNALSKINGYIESVGKKLDSIQTQVVKNDVSDEFVNFIGVAGETPVTAFLQVEHTAGSQYEWKNIIQAVFDKDGLNSDGVDQKAQFMENIEKKPIIEKKAKAGTGGGGGASAPSSNAASKL